MLKHQPRLYGAGFQTHNLLTKGNVAVTKWLKTFEQQTNVQTKLKNENGNWSMQTNKSYKSCHCLYDGRTPKTLLKQFANLHRAFGFLTLQIFSKFAMLLFFSLSGPTQNLLSMQQPLSSGHGASLQKSSSAPESHQQVPSKAPLGSTAGQYDFIKYQNSYQNPVHNIIRPVYPSALGDTRGSGQMYSTGDSSMIGPHGPNMMTARRQSEQAFVSTPLPASYITSGGHYPSQVPYIAPSQGTPQVSPHHSFPVNRTYPGFSHQATPTVFNPQYNAPLASRTLHLATSQPSYNALSCQAKPLPKTGQQYTQASFQPCHTGNTGTSWHHLPGASMALPTGPSVNPVAFSSTASSKTCTGRLFSVIVQK